MRPNTLPLARTNAEAHLFLDLQPCAECGESRCRFRSSVIQVDDGLGSKYTGVCPRCGADRVYRFRIPDEVVPPPAGSVRFGGDEPSELLDPGVWLWYSDVAAKQVPAGTAEPDPETRRAARHALATALAAVEETMKFVPPEADRVPAEAFESLDGRSIYDSEPGRFSRIRLSAIRDHYAEQLERW